MSTKLHISNDLSLPLDIITMRQALYGDSGAGKTAYGRLLAEKVHEARHRFCAIDLKNDWWGLKSSADGSAAGIPVVIFGGPRADVKLFHDPAAAAALADTVASIDQSVIVDLDALSRAKQEKFLAPFLDRLYEANREPLLLFCDEADRYAPQKPMSQEAVMSLSSSEDIARRGRKRGIGSVWLTQRTAVLNKNVSEFANMTVVFRTPGERDLKELEDRVGRIADRETVKEVMRLAPGLANGEAFFLSSHPALRKYMPDPVRPIQLPLPSTFDSSATPGVGHRRREPKVLASADLAAIEAKMAQQVERAKAEDPAALRAKVAQLERELKQRPAETKTREVQKRVEVPVLKDGHVKRVEALADRFTQAVDKLLAEAAELRKVAAPAVTVPKPPAVVNRPKATGISRSQYESFEGGAKRPVPRPAANGDASTDLPRGERAILTAIAQYPEGADREQLTVLTGYKRSSRDTYVQRLRERGHVAESGGRLVATDAGVAALGPDFEPLPTGDALREWWMSRLPEGERRVMEVLIEAFPEACDREFIDANTGYKRSSRDTYLQRLSARRLVEFPGRGEVRAAEALFDAVPA